MLRVILIIFLLYIDVTANSTTINVNTTQDEDSIFDSSWIAVIVEIVSVLIAFIGLWIKMRKERKLQKEKRRKIKMKMNEMYTDIVPSFRSLSESVYKLDTTLNINSELIPKSTSRISLCELSQSKDSSSTTLIQSKIYTDLFVYEDIVDVVIRNDMDFSISTFNDLEINKSIIEIRRIETVITIKEDLRSKLFEHKLYNSTVSDVLFSNIITVLNYTPIDSFQISKSALNEIILNSE